MVLQLKEEYVNAVMPLNKEKGSVRNFFKKPLSQFATMGVLMLVLYVLNKVNNNIIPSSIISALGTTMIYSIVAIGFCLLLGYSGLASLGTAGFIGIGSYSAFYIMQEAGLPYFVAMLVTLAVSIVLGIIVGFISLRIEGMYLAILTLGLSEILRNVLLTLQSTIKLSLENIKLFGVKISDKEVFLLILATFIVMLWLLSNLINSPTGRAMLAMKNSTSAAQAMGISLMKYRLLAFVISTVCAALGGLLYMMLITNVTTSTSQLFSLTTSLNILGAVVIGGARSLWGVTAGTFFIYGFKDIVLNRIPFFSQNSAIIVILTGVLLIVVVMFYPGGLAQMAKSAIAWLKKTKNKHRRWKYGNEE